MNGYWITFEDGTQGYCEGRNEYDAAKIAEKIGGKRAKGMEEWNIDKKFIQKLPYPANPVIWQLDHPVDGKRPAFCYKPKQCVGRSCCPQAPACTE